MRTRPAALVLLSLTACVVHVGNGDVVTETRDVVTFDAVSNSTFLDVDILVSETEPSSVRVTCDSNLLDLIETDVRAGTLTIRTDRGVQLRSDSRCTAELVTSGLVAAANTGSGDLFASGDLHQLVETANTGSGDMELSGIDTDGLDVANTGSGDIVTHGQCHWVEIQNTGSGVVDARELIADSVDVTSTGSGDVAVYAEDSCEVHATGSGDVYVYGHPSDLSQSTTGSGDVVIR